MTTPRSLGSLPPAGEQASLGAPTRAAGEGPHEVGIDGLCESSREADSQWLGTYQ